MYVKILNPDGSEVPKSGNGMGIFAKYLKDAGYVQKTSVSWMTISGEENVFYLNEEEQGLRYPWGGLLSGVMRLPVTGERREMVNQTMDVREDTVCNHLSFPGKSTLRYLDERDIQGSGMQNR